MSVLSRQSLLTTVNKINSACAKILKKQAKFRAHARCCGKSFGEVTYSRRRSAVVLQQPWLVCVVVAVFFSEASGKAAMEEVVVGRSRSKTHHKNTYTHIKRDRITSSRLLQRRSFFAG
ncbi:hypothetical protein NDU88_008521 [Pleurodeles waltl]|uniref:Uncharacterized protein n=1 Tax=Pleurodeles waltl TaxID=8319 RepID=A0AAV7QQX5_PLEWA|nr:hypothetical protein NDU88_008521 [Pleurodeles waltl]